MWNLKIITTEALFSDLSRTMAAPLLEKSLYPWEILDPLGAFIAALGQGLDGAEYRRLGDGIYVAADARVAPTAAITGPCIIGRGAEIRHGAFIRGNVLVGAGAVVGNSTELKNCVLFDGVQVPHFNYVGDSVLGYKAHFGAGAVTSNVKSDRSPVWVGRGETRISSGRKKLGAMVGDLVEVGCHAVLNPGTVLGPRCRVYPTVSVRGVVPAGCICKDGGTIVPIRTETAE